MKAHVIGIPVLFKCECGWQFVIGKWSKEPLDTFLTLEFLGFAGEIKYCPSCGGQGGITREERP